MCLMCLTQRGINFSKESLVEITIREHTTKGGPFQGIRQGLRQDMHVLYCYRELLYFLVWRDLKVRYRQALLGLAWLLIRPLSTVALFTFLLSVVAHVHTGDIPYPLFVLIGMLPWQCVVGCLAEGGNSLVSHGPIIAKIAFPKLVVPVSAACVQGIDFLLASLCCLPFLLVSGSGNGSLYNTFSILSALWLLPLWLLQLALLCIGLTCWISALVALYRDVKFMIPFFLQAGLFLSPIGYSLSALPYPWRILYSCNPLVGVVEGLRFSLLGIASEGLSPLLLLSFCCTLLLFVSGLHYFRHVERTLVDRM